MSQRGLEGLLRPKAIAVVGASEQPYRSGHLIMKNLLAGSFSGPILPVNPRYDAICGVLAWPSIEQLPKVPDLAILCTNASHYLELIEKLAAKGCKACILLSAPSKSEQQLLKRRATNCGMRLLGPNSLGIIAPWQGVNASFSPISCQKGRVAFISQSAAVTNTVLDWAQQRNLGFSWVITLGDSLDIDADDLLDFVARDPKTTAVVLSVEQLQDARRFVSAARSASRNKPVLMIKTGRSHNARKLLGTLETYDGAWDAAIQRAGMLRVTDTHELFSAIESLTHMRPLRGERLFIISNGIAPAAMALDELSARNGSLATLGDETVRQLRISLPDHITITNPLDLKDDADTKRFTTALNILLSSQDIDALMVIHAPSAVSPATECAQHIADLVNSHPRKRQIALLTNWCGEHSSQLAREIFTQAGIPTWRTPEGTVTAFMHRVEYLRNQRQLRETPTRVSTPAQGHLNARQQLTTYLERGINQLSTHQLQEIFGGYEIQVVPTWLAQSGRQAADLAEHAGYPVAVKLYASQDPHKSEIQGVMLYLATAAEVTYASNAILERANLRWPADTIHGVLVQSMVQQGHNSSIKIILRQDPLFGPIIMLGEADHDWHEDTQAAVGLLPLNMSLAGQLINRAIKARKIRFSATEVETSITIISQLLVKLSELMIECPELKTLSLNALTTRDEKLLIIDANAEIGFFTGESEDRLAIRPYPQRLEKIVQLQNGEPCLLRPILPEDEPLLLSFISQVTQQDLYYRYFSEINEFTHEDLANMTQIDYDREMAFVAVRQCNEYEEIIGVSRAITDADNQDGEFSVLVRSDLKRLGLGGKLLEKMVDYSQQHGTQCLNGITMPENQSMIKLARKLGFTISYHLDEGIVSLQLKLTSDTE